MQFDARSLTISTHRRIELQNCHVYRINLRPTLKQSLTDHSGKMLHKIYRLRHRLGHQLIHLGIVDGVRHLVTLYGTVRISLQSEVDFIVVTNKTLLRLHAVKGMETQGT